MDIIIDAYNLIFQCGLEGRSRTPATIRRSRIRLINLLAENLSLDQRKRTTVVFDAVQLPAGEKQIEGRRQGMQIKFSVGYPDADSMIEDLIAAHSHPKKLLVVSSDHRIQRAATRRKAKAVDSDVWLDQIESETASRNSSESDNGDNQTDNGAYDWRAEFDLATPKASQELVREIENEIADDFQVKSSEGIEDIEKQFKEVDWMREFGFEEGPDK
jgi:predicted RNA-binding protein with PIN domain